MDNNIVILSIIFIGYLVLFSLMLVHGDTISCIQTPFPQICHHYINRDLRPDLNISRQTFRHLAFRVSMNEAAQAYQLLSSMDMSSFDGRGKLAWNDCLELHHDTINQLNRSIRSNNPSDHLTWLSASIANQQTCQNGFIDFNLSSNLQSFPLMFSNFSKLLSNSLAISKAPSSASHFSEVSTKSEFGGRRRLLSGDNFPRWISGFDRKLMQSSDGGMKGVADVIVAKDGSGNYTTVGEAIGELVKLRKGRDGLERLIIYVKAGVYKENVEIERKMKNIMIVGDGINSTIISGSKNVIDGSTTFRSATFAVSGNGFIAQDITFENTAGPHKHQAVAVRSSADHSVFYRCSFKGYQDTLYVHSQRQFYRDCNIYGTVDFIFGDAVAEFQNCNIYVRKPMINQKNTITAQSRSDPNENTGIIIHNSRITAAPDLRPVQFSYKTYLGRPWKKYSRTVVMKTDLDGLIDPTGWLPWSGKFALDTLYYGEYMNTGRGASVGKRVKWPGFHVITNGVVAGIFTVEKFFADDSWILGTRVPFAAGL